MPKKTSSAHAAPQTPATDAIDADLMAQIRTSAQQIWLAGLGAFSKAQAEGGRVFESLVQDGVTLQRKTLTAAEDKLAAVSAQTAGQWDRLGRLFEQRVASALVRLGVPQASDVQALIAQVEQLHAEVAQLRVAVSQPARQRRTARPQESSAPAGSAAPAATTRRTPQA